MSTESFLGCLILGCILLGAAQRSMAPLLLAMLLTVLWAHRRYPGWTLSVVLTIALSEFLAFQAVTCAATG